MSNNNDNHVSINDCPDLTPNDGCDITCCPDYNADDDFCKAFNKRTLEQQKEVTRLVLDGIWYNIEDAKNTISQIEQYLACVYELLVASLDQLMKTSSTAGRTEGDHESASARIKEYANEIRKLVNGANYNGRRLLKDHGNGSTGNAGSTDSAVHTIIFRVANHRGFVRNVVNTMNDFTIHIPNVGPTALGLDDFETNGLNSWDNTGDPEEEGVNSPDTAADDDVDLTITSYNNAIKLVMNEFDKMKAYRFLICGREKQVRIWKNGQDICFNHKCKI
jgi:hypothetical protein